MRIVHLKCEVLSKKAILAKILLVNLAQKLRAVKAARVLAPVATVMAESDMNRSSMAAWRLATD